MSAEYKKAHERYRQAAALHVRGQGLDGKPLEGRSDKAKIMGEIRQMERESARDGKVLSAVYKGDQVVVNSKEISTKRSLQEEYIRKFDEEKTAMLNGKEQTLREYHAGRLLKR